MVAAAGIGRAGLGRSLHAAGRGTGAAWFRARHGKRVRHLPDAVRAVPRQPERRPRADAKRPARDDARENIRSDDDRGDAAAVVGAQRRPEESAGGIHGGPADGQRDVGSRREHGLPVPHQPAARRSGERALVERLEPGPGEHALSARGGRAADGGPGAAPHAQMGVRLPLRACRPTRSRPSHRAASSSAATTASFIRSTRRQDASTGRSRPVPSSGTRSRRRGQRRRRCEVRGVCRRRPRQRLRHQRAGRKAPVEDEGRSAFRRAHHRRHPLLRRQGDRPGLVLRGVQQRQPRLLLLHLARQRRRARRGHGQADLEGLGHPRRAEAVQDDGERRDAVCAGRRRRVELADDRSGEARHLLRHRRRDDGPVGEDDGRHHGDRSRHREAPLGVSGDRERRLHGRLQRRRTSARRARSRWAPTWTSAIRRS